MADDTRIAVWRLLDGKPGHENQSQGLLQALAEVLDVQQYDLEISKQPIRQLLFKTASPYREVPAPDLIVAVGHAAHLPALAARRHFGGRVVVLMKPSLPVRWFDLCVIPEHDGVADGPRVLATRGVLNKTRPAPGKDPRHAMMLIGGPSRHHDWDEADIVGQIRTLIGRDRAHWTIATSRRTPTSTVIALRNLTCGRISLVEPSQINPGWLPAQLATASTAWISEDSVSMVYEAVTSGAACGILRVPQHRPNRVTFGLQGLIRDRYAVTFLDYLDGEPLVPTAAPLNEAHRCASRIRDSWFSGAARSAH